MTERYACEAVLRQAQSCSCVGRKSFRIEDATRFDLVDRALHVATEAACHYAPSLLYG